MQLFKKIRFVVFSVQLLRCCDFISILTAWGKTQSSARSKIHSPNYQQCPEITSLLIRCYINTTDSISWFCQTVPVLPSRLLKKRSEQAALMATGDRNVIKPDWDETSPGLSASSRCSGCRGPGWVMELQGLRVGAPPPPPPARPSRSRCIDRDKSRCGDEESLPGFWKPGFELWLFGFPEAEQPLPSRLQRSVWGFLIVKSRQDRN